MIYAVDHHLDKITARPEPKPPYPGLTQYGDKNFATEREARDFLIERAMEGVRIAEKDLKNSKARVAKCHRKFGFRLVEAVP